MYICIYLYVFTYIFIHICPIWECVDLICIHTYMPDIYTMSVFAGARVCACLWSWVSEWAVGVVRGKSIAKWWECTRDVRGRPLFFSFSFFFSTSQHLDKMSFFQHLNILIRCWQFWQFSIPPQKWAQTCFSGFLLLLLSARCWCWLRPVCKLAWFTNWHWWCK